MISISSCVEIVPSITLSAEQLEKFEKIIPLIKDRTTTGLHDIGLYTQDEMEIIVDDRSPLVEPQYSPPKKVQEMVLEDIELMIKYGILEESRGSYQSPLIAKLKGDGKIRLVNNYKTINRRIKDVQFPIPRTKEVLAEIQGKKYISTVDFYKGFYHIPLKRR